MEDKNAEVISLREQIKSKCEELELGDSEKNLLQIQIAEKVTLISTLREELENLQKDNVASSGTSTIPENVDHIIVQKK